jgi:phosphoenolpyruvate synthase/pyruvate phosphate dikinase
MIIDLDTQFPEDLSVETVCAVAELLNEMANQWESRYFHRIRAYQDRQQLDLFDADQPWSRKDRD